MTGKVLHITPHLNGGLGKVLLSTLKYFNRGASTHEVLVYGPSNLLPEEFTPHRDSISFEPNIEGIRGRLQPFELIQIEYWNHPLIYKLLCSGVLDKARVIGCAHIQGESPPQLITNESIRYFDKLLLTGISSEKILQESKLDSRKLREIRFPLDLSGSRFNERSRNATSSRVVLGYVGTLSYAKLHKCFLRMCSELDRNIKLVIVGRDEDGRLEQEAKNDYPKLAAEFLGFRTDISDILQTIDVFVYPLRRGHYGTGELALVEALHSGAATLAFNNPGEQRLIVDGVTGLLADDEADFVSKLTRLCDDASFRRRLGINANRHIVERYSIEKCFEDIENCYRDVCRSLSSSSDISERSYHCLEAEWADDFQEGFRLFLESMRDARESHRIFLDYFKARSSGEANRAERAEAAMLDFFRDNTGFEHTSKGGLGHYLHVFPGDEHLEQLHRLALRALGRAHDVAMCSRPHPVTKLARVVQRAAFGVFSEVLL